MKGRIGEIINKIKGTKKKNDLKKQQQGTKSPVAVLPVL